MASDTHPEPVPAALLEPGDVIVIHHEHDSNLGPCRVGCTDVCAIVTDPPGTYRGRVRVSWRARYRRTQRGITAVRPEARIGRVAHLQQFGGPA